MMNKMYYAIRPTLSFPIKWQIVRVHSFMFFHWETKAAIKPFDSYAEAEKTLKKLQ